MTRKPAKLAKLGVLLAASSILALTPGCSDDDELAWWLPSPWQPVFTVTTIGPGTGGTGGTGGQNLTDPAAGVPSVGGVARSGISGNNVSVGGVP